MGGLGLVLVIGIAIASLVGYIPMVGLLFISGFFTLYCLVILFNKGEYLTEIGKLLLVFSVVGLAISIPDMFFNINVISLFKK